MHWVDGTVRLLQRWRSGIEALSKENVNRVNRKFTYLKIQIKGFSLSHVLTDNLTSSGSEGLLHRKQSSTSVEARIRRGDHLFIHLRRKRLQEPPFYGKNDAFPRRILNRLGRGTEYRTFLAADGDETEESPVF